MKIFVGIDCGVNTGYARTDGGGELKIVSSMNIVEAMACVASLDGIAPFKVYIEDARKRKWFTGGREKAQGVGSVKRDCQIWQEFCDHHGFEYELVAPKNNRTKLNAAQFEQLTGWQGRTNEHGRDAGMLLHKYLKNIGCKNEK